jgi:hypothetical protein
VTRRSLGVRAAAAAAGLAAALISATSAHANAGVPMLYLLWPGFGFALIPIIAVEAAVWRDSAKINWKQAITTASLTNIVSTVGGVPVTWGIMLTLELGVGATGYPDISAPWLERLHSVTVQAAWLLPYDNERLSWMIPAATGVFMIPYYLVSVALEGVFAKLTVDAPMKRLFRLSALANAISYGIILMLIACWFLFVVSF